MKKPYAYVGMMASRGRSALLKKQMEEDGFDRKVLDEIHTPVGLDIHAETPEEIAVSIVSELIKEKNSVRKTSGYDAELLDYLTGEGAGHKEGTCDDRCKKRFSTQRHWNKDAGP